jgi:hypothetical protein
MASMARKIAGWLWVGAFYALVLAAGVALVGGGAVLATYALGVLRSDASWHLIWGIALMLAGGSVFVGGAVLLFRITNIAVPGDAPPTTLTRAPSSSTATRMAASASTVAACITTVAEGTTAAVA